MEIIRGTTPTIIFTFEEIDVANLAVALLIIKQNGCTIIEKDLSAGTIADGSLSFTLSQVETLSLAIGSASLCLDWKTTEGIRGRSRIYDVGVKVAGKNEVI